MHSSWAEAFIPAKHKKINTALFKDGDIAISTYTNMKIVPLTPKNKPLMKELLGIIRDGKIVKDWTVY